MIKGFRLDPLALHSAGLQAERRDTCKSSVTASDRTRTTPSSDAFQVPRLKAHVGVDVTGCLRYRVSPTTLCHIKTITKHHDSVQITSVSPKPDSGEEA